MRRSYVAALLVAVTAAACLEQEGDGAKPAASLQFRLIASQAGPDTEEVTDLRSGRTVFAEKKIHFRETDILSAKARQDADSGAWCVEFTFRPEAETRFAEFTEKHVGKRLGIFVDGRLVAAPMIVTRLQGRGLINGNFTKEEAERLAEGLAAAGKSRGK